jgi:hypothetical protein
MAVKVTVKALTPWEAIRPFIADEELKREYMESSKLFRTMDLSDDESIIAFLDTDAIDIEHLSYQECRLLGLDEEKEWYISTFDDEYLIDKEY